MFLHRAVILQHFNAKIMFFFTPVYNHLTLNKIFVGQCLGHYRAIIHSCSYHQLPPLFILAMDRRYIHTRCSVTQFISSRYAQARFQLFFCIFSFFLFSFFFVMLFYTFFVCITKQHYISSIVLHHCTLKIYNH